MTTKRAITTHTNWLIWSLSAWIAGLWAWWAVSTTPRDKEGRWWAWEATSYLSTCALDLLTDCGGCSKAVQGEEDAAGGVREDTTCLPHPIRTLSINSWTCSTHSQVSSQTAPNHLHSADDRSRLCGFGTLCLIVDNDLLSQAQAQSHTIVVPLFATMLPTALELGRR
jgi:hypothetical protein